MKKRRIRLQSMLWMAFVLFSAIVLAAMFVLQFITFDRSYNKKEIHKIQVLGREVTEKWSNVRFSQPVSIRLYQGEATIRIFNAAGVAMNSGVLQVSDPDPLDARRFIQKYEAAGEEEYLDQVNDSYGGGSSYLVYGSRIENPGNPASSIYIYVITSVGPRNIVKDILFTNFFAIAVLMMLISLAGSFFVARFIALPLERITEEAASLADRNYDVKFRENMFVEVDRLSETLNYASTELSRLDQVRDEVMASVSHDLRTPLTVIKAYAEMLRDFSGEIAEKRREHVDIILHEVAWMSDLVEEILEYSRIRYGNEAVAQEPVDLVEMTQSCIKDIHATTLGSNISIIFHRQDVPVVLGDSNRIRRVLHNLIGNAIKHSPENEALEIGVEQVADRVRWYVTDYGEGISEDEQKLIWKRYYTDGKNKKSFGLGLSIVKAILEEHEAEYGIESRKGEGCRFWFCLRVM